MTSRGFGIDYMEIDGQTIDSAPRRDIIDEIDALVDEQLAAGETAGGYERFTVDPDPAYPRCPHCGRHWHGLPITQRIAIMYQLGQFDEDYRVDTDDSPILCHGSESDLPAPERSDRAAALATAINGDGGRPGSDSPQWLRDMYDSAVNLCVDAMMSVFGFPTMDELLFPEMQMPIPVFTGDSDDPMPTDLVSVSLTGGQVFTDYIENVTVSGPSPADRLGSALENLRDMVVAMAEVNCPGGITVRTWLPHFENRRLPMRLEDV